MSTAQPRDQGNLGGLLRVRGVRERDSRTGLATALAEERAAHARVLGLQQAITSFPTPTTLDLTDFQARQHTLEAHRVSLAAARNAEVQAAQLVAAARERWVADQNRLAAVESLVERRAAAARAERTRRENREMDAVAEETWRRNAARRVAVIPS